MSSEPTLERKPEEKIEIRRTFDDAGIDLYFSAQEVVFSALEVNCPNKESCPLYQSVKKLASAFKKITSRRQV